MVLMPNFSSNPLGGGGGVRGIRLQSSYCRIYMFLVLVAAM